MPTEVSGVVLEVVTAPDSGVTGVVLEVVTAAESGISGIVLEVVTTNPTRAQADGTTSATALFQVDGGFAAQADGAASAEALFRISAVANGQASATALFVPNVAAVANGQASATVVLAQTFAARADGEADAVGILGPVQSKVASYKVEAHTSLEDAASVSSYKVEIHASVRDTAKVSSYKVEAHASREAPTEVSSYKIEAHYSTPAFPYLPYVSGGGGGGSTCLCGSTLSSTGFGSTSFGWTTYGGCACNCAGSGPPTPTVTEYLAFEKTSTDGVLLCTRGLSGLIPTGEMSAYSWVRVAGFSATGTPQILDVAEFNTAGWSLRFGGSAAPEDLVGMYVDTSNAERTDIEDRGSTFVGAGWRAVGVDRTRGILVDATTTRNLRAWVDAGAGTPTNYSQTPAAGEPGLVTVFGPSTGSGPYWRGLVLNPTFVLQDLGTAGQASFLAAQGGRTGLPLSSRNLVLAPRAPRSAAPGDAIACFPVDRTGAATSAVSVLVYGTPAYWRGPRWGLSFADAHWMSVAWPTNPRTLLLGYQLAGVPAGPEYLAGRPDGGSGGIEVVCQPTVGVPLDVLFYDVSGTLSLSLSLTPNAEVGRVAYLAVLLPAGGVGTVQVRAYSDAGDLLDAASGTATVSLSSAQRWGRDYTTGKSFSGLARSWSVSSTELTDEEIAAFILSPYSQALGDLVDIRGVDSNVIDDGDDIRLWGPYDPAGVYASSITYAGTGTTTIVPGL